ncbi:hypothetical protein [Domibacillus sp.]|nr:hypothetical protein [Domibacillus sp.]
MNKKAEKKRKDKWDTAHVLLELITSGGELIIYGIRALVRWWN